jgi:hypothetical protein
MNSVPWTATAFGLAATVKWDGLAAAEGFATLHAGPSGQTPHDKKHTRRIISNCPKKVAKTSYG